jgi:nicotinamide-nucleotide amidase
MRAEVISVGTELLLGDIVDTNAVYIAQQLRSIGLDLIYRTTVGDNEERIARVVDHALSRVDIVIVTGGLGPTVDDKTREGIALATGRPLEFRPELLEQIAERFRRFNVTMSDNNRQQAFVPQGAIPIENPVGTAPIFILETERGAVMVLPGVPREMKHLLDNHLILWLRERIGAPAVIVSRVLRTAGIGESQVDARIADLETASNPTVGLAAHAGQTDIRITAKAATEEDALAMIAPVEEEVRRRVGVWIYGTGQDLLEAVVADLLAASGARVAVVEAGSRGLLGRRLAEAAVRQPALLASAVEVDSAASIADVSLEHPPALESLALHAAVQARLEHNADYGLALMMHTSGEPGAHEAVTSAAIAVASVRASRTRRFEWLDNRPDANVWTSTHALAMLRRMLISAPADGDTLSTAS